MKIIIPMAGAGKRLGPLTQHRPKALVRLADKRLIDHVLDSFREVEKAYPVEYIFILGYLGEQIKEYMRVAHPDKVVTYFAQEELLGQSHAVFLARDAISGPILLTYCDTLNDMDFSFLASDSMEGVASVQEVDDPRSHGVAAVGAGNLITKLVEKPDTTENKLALTGVYYFCEGKELISAIETQIQRGSTIKNEYYLADAINILIERGMRIRVERVKRWLDAGTPEALIKTNAALLQGYSTSTNETDLSESNLLIPPYYIHGSSRVEHSIIGPNVSIGENCFIRNSILRNTIVDDSSTVDDANLHNSLLGRGSCVKKQMLEMIVGDYDVIGE